MELTSAKVFMIGESRIIDEGLEEFLNYIGVPDWNTDAPTDAEKITEVAGKTCYMSFDTALNANLTRIRQNMNRDYIQDGLIKVKHGSVLEHTCVTFALCDVTRVMTHELIRHRAGTAFSQLSGRYVRQEQIKAYLPDCFDEKATNKFIEVLTQTESAVKELEEYLFGDPDISFAQKKQLTSALRRLIPEGHTSTIIFTANHRALRHIIDMRTSEHAEEEIRYVFKEIAGMLKARYPNIYEDLTC